MKALVREFWQEEDGLQSVEMVLILIIMVGLVITFKTSAEGWLGKITTIINDQVTQILPSTTTTT